MPRKNKTDQELSWLRNVWEEVAATELKHGATVDIVIRAGATRGVFTVTFLLVRPEVDKGMPGFTYRSMLRYPNGYQTQFLPWLWGRAGRFAEEVAEGDIAVARLEETAG
jgi:hypothetical protein